MQRSINREDISVKILTRGLLLQARITSCLSATKKKNFAKMIKDERGDVPGWVLVVLMTTGLVTAIWTIAAPRLSAILKNSLDAMNGIR
jgi:ribosomal protein L39E